MKPIVALLLLLHFCGFTQTAPQPIDTLIERKMHSAGIVGLAAAIVSDKDIIWSGEYGYADLNKHIPYNVNTIINIGSISKPITGICIMRAVQEGRLSL